MNPFIKNIINHLVGDLLRKAFFTVGLWLSAKGVGYLTPDSQSNLVDLAVGAIAFIGSVGWSYARNSKALNNKLKLDEITNAFSGSQAQARNAPPISIIQMLVMGFMVAALTSCAIVAPFDQAALDSDVLIKMKAMDLIQHGTEQASVYQSQIDSLNADISSKIAIESGKGKKNFVVQKQWEILTSPDHLLGRFLKEWSAGKVFSKEYLDEEKILVEDSFNQILESESAKQR
jgi:hypothetical protein